MWLTNLSHDVPKPRSGRMYPFAETPARCVRRPVRTVQRRKDWQCDAVCGLVSLRPGSREQGSLLAQSVMDGDYALEPLKGASSEARAMLALLGSLWVERYGGNVMKR